MPYIDQGSRQRVDPAIDKLIAQLQPRGDIRMAPGELNYVITRLLLAAWSVNPSYTVGNGLVGVLDCAKAEFYRRHLAPYEDEKIEQNGDVH